ncbi:hypothetical protein F8388_013948 [Cannabis sativa]|uniref:Uncharacterized protein n=1 Tax=Cannabis sativa TaxID=3483 RepID=A0A7J6F845_CANSA|nr:hypothetical protein F8388_013948 [Cannabis sativa]
MSAVVEMCMNELGKLGQKVGAAGKRRLVFLPSKPKQDENQHESQNEENIKAAAASSSYSSSTLSEDTVFLLMDRFAPV